MATTRIMPLHVGKGRTESRAISDIIDYVANPKKTDNGLSLIHIFLYEQIDEITEGIAEVQASGGERFTVKQLERTRKSLEARLEKLQAEGRKDDVVTFEQLGVCLLYTSGL